MNLYHYLFCAGCLWIHAAAKPPDAAEVAVLEGFYKSLYESAGVDVTFPTHYPTSALLGCVDLAYVLSNEEFKSLPGVHPSVRA